jgi:adenosylhomocysteine nucleosidase
LNCGESGGKQFNLKTIICFALKEEAAPFRKIAAGKTGITILLTGIGRQNAEKSLREFLLDWGAHASGVPFSASRRKPSGATPEQARETRALPELVLTCGFAGGLNPELKLGDVVFETSDETLRAKLFGAGAKPLKIFCADRIATTVAEKKKLRAETGADAVEMESAAIHAVCRERGILCATIRVISDTASEDLPLDFNALSKPDKNLDFGKLFLAIAKSPGKIGALMELQKKTKFAAEQLAAVLAKITFP